MINAFQFEQPATDSILAVPAESDIMKLAFLNSNIQSLVDTKTASTSVCVPYSESTREEFIRLTAFFIAGGSSQVIDV